jgi:hypothetical protein
MFDGTSQNSKASACNDNGALGFALRRGGQPKSVLTIAERVCESVLLSYVASGSMILSGQHLRSARRAAQYA